MITFQFDRNYHNTEQVRPFMAAYLSRYAELKAAGQYPYNDSFKGYLGGDWATPRDENTAIYLCQTLRDLDELAARIAAALADGYVEITGIGPLDAPIKCSTVVQYGWYMGGTGWQEWHDARLMPFRNTNRILVLPKGKRTNGHLITGGHVLAKVMP